MTWRPTHLSVSAIALYVRCPAAFYRRYVAGRPEPPTPALAFGRAMALALEALHRGQDADQAWVEAYQAHVAPLAAAGAPSLRHGLLLLDRYRQRGVGQGEPEWRFELPLPSGAVPVPIVGVCDLVTADEVWEFKTSSQRWDQGRVDAAVQGHVYRWAVSRLRGRAPRAVRYLVFSTRRVALEEFVTYPSGGDLHLFELQAAAVWRGIVAGAFPPRCGRCLACQEAADGVA